MAAKLFLVASVLLVAVAAPFTVASPLPISFQSNLGAQKNMDILLPEGATSITADTINNLSIVFADTVYIMADGTTVVPENPSTTVVPPATTTAPTNGGTGAPVITPPTFPGRK